MKAETSVILAVHNVLSYTQQCIEVLRNRFAGTSYEILVIDNGSSDGTDLWLSMQPDLRVVRNEENWCLAAAWNQGWRASSGRTLLFMHNDVVLSEQAFRQLHEVLWSRTDIGAVGPHTNRGEQPLQVLKNVTYQTFEDIQDVANQLESLAERAEPLTFLGSGCLMMKREALESVGGFDERYETGGYETIDFCLQLLKKGYFTVKVNTYVHHELGTFARLGIPRADIWEKNIHAFEEKWGFDAGYSTNIRFDLLNYIDRTARNVCVLDVGCSCGGTLMWLKYYYPGAELYGIELNASAASVAKSYGQVEVMDVETITRPEWREKFDYIMMGDVIEHLQNPWKILKKVRDFLKPEGKLLVSIPNVNHISILKEMLQGKWQYENAGILDRTHLRFFTRQSFTEYLRNAGLQVEHVEANPRLDDEDRELLKGLLPLGDVQVTKDELEAYQWMFVAQKAIS